MTMTRYNGDIKKAFRQQRCCKCSRDLNILVASIIIATCCIYQNAVPVPSSRAAAFSSTSAATNTRHDQPLYPHLFPEVIQHDVYFSYYSPVTSSSGSFRRRMSLLAGRERRVSSQKDPPQQQQQQQQQQQHQQQYDSKHSEPRNAYSDECDRLIKMEELARQKRINEMNQRLQKAASREERISFLEAKLAGKDQQNQQQQEEEEVLTDAERAELNGLLRVRDEFEEQYDPSAFSKEHLEFKDLHNDAFIQLVRYCERKRVEGQLSTTCRSDSNGDCEKSTTKVFFLDGPDGRTASALIHRGDFNAEQCYVANRHTSTCVSLRQSGGGLLPECNVVEATASEALSKRALSKSTLTSSSTNDNGGEENNDTQQRQGAFAELDFAGYYFDSCAGYAPRIVNMMSSAVMQLKQDDNSNRQQQQQQKEQHIQQNLEQPIAVGYSLIGGHKKRVENELTISRALTVIARSRGMRVVHALDDPLRYGITPSIPKVVENTFTTWLLLEPE